MSMAALDIEADFSSLGLVGKQGWGGISESY